MTWWRRLLRQQALERALDAELRDHLEREIADRVRAGESEADVRRHMRLTSGGLDIDLPTFTATADLAALSRAMGGYHIPLDNNVGLKVGRELAAWSWPKYQAYFNGTAPIATK